MDFNITIPDKSLIDRLIRKVNHKTKPAGSLGMLEEIAIQVGLIRQSLTPSLDNPCILVFAGDHGIAKEKVSAYPQEVTYQMVYNFLSGGAAINVFARQNSIGLRVIDAGVNHDFGAHPWLVQQKVDYGTRSFLDGPAMTKNQLQQALDYGKKVVNDVAAAGTNIIGFGEMGIGNTASASMIMSRICGIELNQCVGRGTGLDDRQVQLKYNLLTAASRMYPDISHPLDILQSFGGFEMVQMCGAMLRAAELHMVVLVDGFIATATFLVAQALCPAIKSYAIVCHRSGEKGHKLMLDYLKMTPLINLNMRLGEGTGCAVAYPIVKSAVAFLNDMASFEEAGVSQKTDE